jgi:hypothetical protein
VCMILAAICLTSLRPTQEGKWFRINGITILVLSGASCFACAILILQHA